MQTVKRTFGVTMNDVALALSADVLRRYLLQRGELPERPLVAQIPVGLKRDGDARGGNLVAATGASLCTDIVDPVERLAAIHASMQSAKAMQAALNDDIVIDALAVVPPAVITAGLDLYLGLGIDTVHPPIFNAIISNVPGPPITLYSCGARVAEMYALGPLLAGCGLNITLASYQHRFDFGIAVCPDVVEEPWELADEIPLRSRSWSRRRTPPEPQRRSAASGSPTGPAAPDPVGSRQMDIEYRNSVNAGQGGVERRRWP